MCSHTSKLIVRADVFVDWNVGVQGRMRSVSKSATKVTSTY